MPKRIEAYSMKRIWKILNNLKLQKQKCAVIRNRFSENDNQIEIGRTIELVEQSLYFSFFFFVLSL